MNHDHMTNAAPPWMMTLNALFNLAIVAGYFSVPFTALPRLIPWTAARAKDTRFYRFVRVSGVLFFITCALHHLSMALGSQKAAHPVTWMLVVDEAVQAVAVWCFVLGFNRIVAMASRRGRAKEETSEPEVTR